MPEYHAPIGRALDPSDGQLIADLIPAGWNLTEMIWRAVQREDWKNDE